MSIYTRTGDTGTTSTMKDTRNKADPLIHAIGEIDELNSYIGILIAYDIQIHSEIQKDLFGIGSLLAGVNIFGDADVYLQKRVSEMENLIDFFQGECPVLRNFILPGGTIPIATIHITRCVCRRAERSVVMCKNEEHNDYYDSVIKYLNRMSDYFFALARHQALLKNIPEILWDGKI